MFGFEGGVYVLGLSLFALFSLGATFRPLWLVLRVVLKLCDRLLTLSLSK